MVLSVHIITAAARNIVFKKSSRIRRGARGRPWSLGAGEALTVRATATAVGSGAVRGAVRGARGGMALGMGGERANIICYH